MNIRSYIQQKKEAFRQRKLEQAKVETKQLQEEAKIRTERAKYMEELNKAKKIETEYQQKHPSVLMRLGQGLSKTMNKGKDIQKKYQSKRPKSNIRTKPGLKDGNAFGGQRGLDFSPKSQSPFK